MVMITDRLITVERKMLHLERELHIVKLQQSSLGRHPLCTTQTTTPVCPQHTTLPPLSSAYCTASPVLSILHCQPFQSTILTLDAEVSSTTTNQPYHKSITHTISIITSAASGSSTHYKSRSPTEPLNQLLICSPT